MWDGQIAGVGVGVAPEREDMRVRRAAMCVSGGSRADRRKGCLTIFERHHLDRRAWTGTPDRCGRGLAPFGGPHAQHHLRALAGQAARDLQADAAAGPVTTAVIRSGPGLPARTTLVSSVLSAVWRRLRRAG